MYSLADAISVKEDWGHSSNVVGVELCQLARARHLCMFHHEPIFDDERIAARAGGDAAARGDHARRSPRRRSRRPRTAWRSRSEDRSLTATRRRAAPAASGRVHWAERRWVRALRGGRGRPLGLVLLLAALVVAARPRVPGRSAPAPRLLRRAASAARRASARPAPAVIVDDRRGEPRAARPVAVAAHAGSPGSSSRSAEARPAAIGLDIVMPEPDRLSPGRLARLIPGHRPASSPGGSPPCRATTRVLAAGAPGAAHRARRGRARRPPRPRRSAPGSARRPSARVGGDPAPFVRRFAGALRSVDEIDARGRGPRPAERGPGARRGAAHARCSPRSAAPLVPALGARDAPRGRGRARARRCASARAASRRWASATSSIPTQPDGSVWIHYARHDPARFVSAADVLAGRGRMRERFEDKLVLDRGHRARPLATTRPRRWPTGCRASRSTPSSSRASSTATLLSRPPLARWIEAAVLAAAGGLLLVAVRAAAARARRARRGPRSRAIDGGSRSASTLPDARDPVRRGHAVTRPWPCCSRRCSA